MTHALRVQKRIREKGKRNRVPGLAGFVQGTNLGLARTKYIRSIHTVFFGREITLYSCSVYIRFWPTLIPYVCHRVDNMVLSMDKMEYGISGLVCWLNKRQMWLKKRHL
jgi:hypothetical protein